MQTLKTKVLGVEVSYEAPSVIEDVAAIWGDRGIAGVLADATDKVLQHNTKGVWREAVVEALEKKTGIAPLVIKTIPPSKEGGKETKVYESDETYCNRVKAETEMAEEEFVALVREVAEQNPLDASTKARKVGGNKEYLEMADKVIEAANSGVPTPRGLVGNQVFDHVVKMLQKANKGLEIVRADDGSVTREVLAAAYRTHFEREKAEAANKLGL